MIALTGCTGKLGGATLNAFLSHNIVPASELVVCTTGDPDASRWDALKAKGVTVRHSNFDDPSSMVKAFAGCSKLLIVSSPRIALDFNDAPIGEGREKHHVAAIVAAEAAGVQHVFYTSLAFGSKSKAGVMRAHNRTEDFLQHQSKIKFTSIREGLYNSSWPLYFGHYDPAKDDRKEIVLAGDGPISWTDIPDLGYATALVIAEPSAKYEGKTFYLSAPTARSLADVAKVVSEVKGTEIKLKIVSLEEHRRYYVEERGMDKGLVDWWSTTYEALKDGECFIKDSTLTDLLSSKGVTLKPVEETIKNMLSAS